MVRNRACIWINNELANNCILLSEFSNRDQTAIMADIEIPGRPKSKIVLCSIYLPSLDDNKKSISNPVTKELLELVNFCKLKNLPFFIGGDVNSKHTIWGNKFDCTRGINLLNFIDMENLIILNRGNSPTNNQGNIIDMTLCSGGLERSIHNWSVLNSDSYSDHKYISFTLDCEPTEPLLFRSKKKVNWDKFRHILKGKLDSPLEPINNPEDLNEQANILSKHILDAYKSSSEEKI